MKGLLIKEWYALCGMNNFKVLLFFAIGCAGFGMMESTAFMLLYLPIIAGMIPRTVMMFDENSKWTQFSLAMPYSRRDIVTVKYLETLILCTAGALLSCAFYVIAGTIHGNFSSSFLFLLLACGIGGGLLIPSFSFPFDLKYGTAKGKYLTLIYGGLLGGASGIVMHLRDANDSAAAEKAASLFAENLLPMMKILPLIAAAVILVAFGISWMISVNIYEKREF